MPSSPAFGVDALTIVGLVRRINPSTAIRPRRSANGLGFRTSGRS